MTVKDLIEKLKNMPKDAEVTMTCYYRNDNLWDVPCTGYLDEVLFDKNDNTVDLYAEE